MKANRLNIIESIHIIRGILIGALCNWNLVPSDSFHPQSLLSCVWIVENWNPDIVMPTNPGYKETYTQNINPGNGVDMFSYDFSFNNIVIVV